MRTEAGAAGRRNRSILTFLKKNQEVAAALVKKSFCAKIFFIFWFVLTASLLFPDMVKILYIWDICCCKFTKPLNDFE